MNCGEQRESDGILVCEIVDDGPCERESNHSAGEREDEALGEELAYDPETTSSEGAAHGELFAAGSGAAELKVRKIYRNDEENESDRRPEDEKRTLQLPATWSLRVVRSEA